MQTQENDRGMITLTGTFCSLVQITCISCCFPVLTARVKFLFCLMTYLYTITDNIHISAIDVQYV